MHKQKDDAERPDVFVTLLYSYSTLEVKFVKVYIA